MCPVAAAWYPIDRGSDGALTVSWEVEGGTASFAVRLPDRGRVTDAGSPGAYPEEALRRCKGTLG